MLLAAVALAYGATTKHPVKKHVATKKVAAKRIVIPPPRPELLPVTDLEQTEPATAPESHIETQTALDPFFDSLNRARMGASPVHILQFGDSHTASDDWVSEMRNGLQSRFGVGGPGFILPGSPFRGYRRYDTSGSNSLGWTIEGTVAHPGDGQTGLSGLNLTAHAPNQTVTVRASGQRMEVHYLRSPTGGSMEFSVDGRPVELISTRGEPGLDIYHYDATPGEHEYRLRTVSSDPVRVFGWASDQPNGLTFETLGINGAQASLIRTWERALWQPEVQSRRPSLVLLEYGTNEANSPKWTAERYIAELQDVIARVRQAAPMASILMIGPPDCGKLKPLVHLDQVVMLQRLVAKQNDIAFWDWRDRMGGPRAIVRWAQAGYGQPDHIHLTGVGYRLIGRVLVNDLMAAYNTYLATRLRTAIPSAPTTYDPAR